MHVKLPSLVVASGSTTSQILPLFEDAASVVIVAPSTLEGAATVQVSPNGGVTFGSLIQDGTTVTVGTSQAKYILAGPWNALRLTMSTAAAPRTFVVGKDSKEH